MSPITDARLELAQAVSSFLPEIPVFSSPPTQLSAPCVVISLRGAVQTGPGLWSQSVRVLCVGPSGDNEASVQALEEMLWVLAPALSRIYAQKAEWDTPGTVTSVGQTYLASSFDIILDIAA